MSETGKVSVVALRPVGTFLVGDHTISATVLNVLDPFEFNEAGGTLTIGADSYAFTGWDEAASTITLGSATTAAYESSTRVLVDPAATELVATIVLDEEGEGIEAVVPHELIALLTEGIRDPDEGETVEVEATHGGWEIASVVKDSPIFDASAAPIVTATGGGERVQIDGDGTTLYTDDAVQMLTFTTIGTPGGAVVDSAGNIYVADVTNKQVSKFDASGAPVATGGFPFSTTGAPSGIALDASGNIYVATSGTARKFNSAGVAGITFAISATPLGIALDASGNIYIADGTASNMIRKYNSSGTVIATGGFPFSTTGQPYDVTLDSAGNIYVPDITNGKLRKFSSAGVEVVTGGFPITVIGGQPSGVRVDAAGTIYVANLNNIAKYDASGVIDPAYPFGFGLGKTVDLALDTAGTIYAVDRNDALIRKVNPPGNVTISLALITALGRLLALDATISGNLEVDSISSANGLQITSPITALGVVNMPGLLQTWTDFTTTWGGTIGNGTITARYAQIGDTVHFKIEVVGGSTTNWTGGSSLTLPVARTSGGRRQFSDCAARVGSSSYAIRGDVGPGSMTVTLRADPTTAGNALRTISATIPGTFGTSDALSISGTYEAS